MNHDPNLLRNIGLYGHSGAGKTTLAEAMLFLTKASDRLCRVDDNNSNFDFEPEEIKRKMSLSSAFAFALWKKYKINIIDTPGDANFFVDSINCIHAVDTVVLTTDAIEGIKIQGNKAFDLAGDYKLPVIIFLNKLDKEYANFNESIQNIEKSLNKKITPINIPIGLAENFNSVVDLINLKAITFDSDTIKESPIPENMKDLVNKYRENLLENVSEQNDALLEKYLNEGNLTKEEITDGLIKGLQNQTIIPLLCGSAYTTSGVSLLLDAVVNFTPSPLSRNISYAEEKLVINEKAPLASYVFKTIVDPFSGRLNLIRVYSGSFATQDTIYNSKKKIRERIGNILYVTGKKQTNISYAGIGDIVAIPKLKETQTADTFSDEKKPIVLDLIKIPPSAISYAIKPKSRQDEEKLTTSISKIQEEDITISSTRDSQTNELILSGMGQTHLEVTLDKIKRKYQVEVSLETPKVPYKETIKGKAKAQGKYKKQSGGKGQYGDTWIEVEPMPRGKGFEFVDNIFGGAIPKQYIPAVEKGVVEALKKGVIANYPVTDIRVSLYDGSYHDVDSSEMAFKIAGSMGFKKAFKDARPILLEPIMNLEIVVPDEYLGDIIGDINSRRGKVLGMDTKGNNQIIKVQVPLSEILTYANELTSITSGRGSFTMQHAFSDEVPNHIAQKIIEKAAVQKEEEEE
jgi:elongation factor G